MNWFAGTLKLWHTDASGTSKPDYEHRSISLDYAYELMAAYEHDFVFAFYEPYPISLGRKGSI